MAQPVQSRIQSAGPGSVLDSALAGIQRNSNNFATAAARLDHALTPLDLPVDAADISSAALIAIAGTEQARPDPAEQIIAMKHAQIGIQAMGAVVRVDQANFESLLDILA